MSYIGRSDPSRSPGIPQGASGALRYFRDWCEEVLFIISDGFGLLLPV